MTTPDESLPAWNKDENGEWHCDDNFQVQLAFACEFHGFDLPAFDSWLNDVPTCPMKTELLERRGKAVEALRINNNDLATWHLEFLHITKKRDAREQFLLPLAQRDKARQDGTKKERRPKITEWIDKAIDRFPEATREELWNEAPQWLIEQIGLERFKKRVSSRRNK